MRLPRQVRLLKVLLLPQSRLLRPLPERLRLAAAILEIFRLLGAMKLSSLLLGDFADLFQDSRIADIESSARAAEIRAGHSRTQIARLAQTAEQRLREVERENTLLSMMLVRVLQHLAKSQPEETQKMVDEVAAVAKSGIPASTDVLRQMLGLPAECRTPISDYTKPMIVGPSPSQRKGPEVRTKKS